MYSICVCLQEIEEYLKSLQQTKQKTLFDLSERGIFGPFDNDSIEGRIYDRMEAAKYSRSKIRGYNKICGLFDVYQSTWKICCFLLSLNFITDLIFISWIIRQDVTIIGKDQENRYSLIIALDWWCLWWFLITFIANGYVNTRRNVDHCWDWFTNFILGTIFLALCNKSQSVVIAAVVSFIHIDFYWLCSVRILKIFNQFENI